VSAAVDTAAGFPVECTAPIASPTDAAAARVRQTLGHASDKLEAALGSDLVVGQDALDLARAVALVAGVRERLGGVPAAASATPLEAAWAEVDRLTAIVNTKQAAARVAANEYAEADDAACSAHAVAEGIGPRPAKEPS
jgi:hypothetical protein